MKLGTLAQFSKNVTRFKEVVSILIKYGLANWIKENDPTFIKGLLKSSEGENLAGLDPGSRLRMAFTEYANTTFCFPQVCHCY